MPDPVTAYLALVKTYREKAEDNIGFDATEECDILFDKMDRLWVVLTPDEQRQVRVGLKEIKPATP